MLTIYAPQACVDIRQPYTHIDNDKAYNLDDCINMINRTICRRRKQFCVVETEVC